MTDAQSAATPSKSDPGTIFAALADIVYNGSEPSEVYAAVCVAATLLVPGCDHASLMLRGRDVPVTVAASDDIARLVDDLERRTGEGPCLDAIEEEAAQLDPDLATPTGWPRLARRVLAQTPVRGVMGFRLVVDEHKVGALNLFSDTPGAFTTEAAGPAAVLASFAAVSVAAITWGEEAITLRRGLESNREIGKAIGLLMALHDVSSEDAFDILRRTSQNMNVKIADLARTVVKRHASVHGTD